MSSLFCVKLEYICTATTTCLHVVNMLTFFIPDTDMGSVVVKVLGYKPEGRRFETQWGEILNLPNPSGRTTPWGSLSL
jgi:hypothetical protein